MSSLYGLGVSDFVNNIADLLTTANPPNEYSGVVLSSIDDFCWAAPFESMVRAIEFVHTHGRDTDTN